MSSPVTGLHHVTAISGPAQANVDFYAGLLGLRLVKQTVNFDDPGTYHLYYADGEARPGSVLTFFPWDNARAGKAGAGQAVATSYAVQPGAIDGWMEHFAAQAYDAFDAPVERFGERLLPVRDPDGIVLELVETADAGGAWLDGPVPAHLALGAFHGATLHSADPDATARLLTELFGYRDGGEGEGRLRLVTDRADRAATLDLLTTPGETGRMGSGVVHHVAFRVPHDAAQADVREALAGQGFQVTPVKDRQYFRSIYFREPGGLLFEIATDPPGFVTDEAPDALGRALRLPPQHEPLRPRLEASLPALTLPY